MKDTPGFNAHGTLNLIRGHRLATVTMAITSTFGGLSEAVFLVLATRLAFAVTKGQTKLGVLAGRELGVGWAVLLAFALVGVRFLLSLIAGWIAVSMTVRITEDLRRHLMRSFVHASWARQQTDRTGRLQELMTNYASAGSNLVTSFAGVVSAAFGLFALLALAVAVDPLGAAGVILGVGLLGSLLRPLRKVIRSRAADASDAGMALATGLGELANLGLEMQVFGVQQQVEQRVASLVSAGSRSTHRLGVVRALVPNVYTALAYLVLVTALGLATLSDAASLTSLGAVMLVMLRSLSYGQQIQVSTAQITSTRPYVNELANEIDSYRAMAVSDEGDPVGLVGDLELDHVGFEYSDGQPVLCDLQAKIGVREVVGVIGPSGSGKTTLVQLLLGLRSPTSGRVLAGGRDVSTLCRTEWVRRVTFVPQAPRLIRGTVADNIRFFRSDISDEAVMVAARLAHLHDDVTGFPEGYEREVGEGGGQVSGGQQQRLCIARALVETPDVLILDEPTSSLDARSEALVREALGELRERMTVIVIAHRMSTLDICDRIMVVQDGIIKAFDTPERLREDNAFYRDAVALSGLG